MVIPIEVIERMVPGFVREIKADAEIRPVMGMNGMAHVVQSGPTRITLVMELQPRSHEELIWIKQSLMENGQRALILPNGSPIIHPGLPGASPAPVKTKTGDAPKTTSDSW